MAFAATTALSYAQDPADIYHKTVDLEEINQVSLDVFKDDQVEVKSWPGDDILIETSVKINNGDPDILEFFLGKDRWGLAENISGDQLKLESIDKERRFVKGTEFTTSEQVVIVIYMPEEFTEAGAMTYRRASR